MLVNELDLANVLVRVVGAHDVQQAVGPSAAGRCREAVLHAHDFPAAIGLGEERQSGAELAHVPQMTMPLTTSKMSSTSPRRAASGGASTSRLCAVIFFSGAISILASASVCRAPRRGGSRTARERSPRQSRRAARAAASSGAASPAGHCSRSGPPGR